MTTISGFADGILDGTVPPEKEKDALRVISNETRRLSRLVRRMLDASRTEVRYQTDSCQLRFDIVETMARVMISLEGRITSRGLDIDVQFPDGPTIVWGDPDSVTQVCYNLLDNAIKFSTPGTAIRLSIQTKGRRPISVCATLARPSSLRSWTRFLTGSTRATAPAAWTRRAWA
mgnify:CR=1 FL=1